MSSMSTFESRTGKLTCSAETFFLFITDIRNLRQFIPKGTAENLIIEKEECSFNVGALGPVKVRISEKLQPEKVIFSGNALQINDFQLIVRIFDKGASSADVQLSLLAEMNPLLKMVASEPVRKLLETLIDEIEKVRDWDDLREHNRPL